MGAGTVAGEVASIHLRRTSATNEAVETDFSVLVGVAAT